MSRATPIKTPAQPDRILSYFRIEGWSLSLVTISGVFYNIGMIAGPYFEGRLVQCLLDIMQGRQSVAAMRSLVASYLMVILVVQVMRCVKRFYVRRFANNTSRNMRHMLYNSLVNMDQTQLQQQSLGAMMTRAVADVDACVEGMRKFTTEVFDTGVVLVAYLTLLFVYDWRLALLSGVFTPIAYWMAGRLKARIIQYNAAYKKSAGQLNNATMDRISNAVTYRVFGCEPYLDHAYESHLEDYERRAILANLWESAMQPIYNIISMCGVILILYLGSKNVLGTGWVSWNMAAFTTFLSCFTKMALKSSKAAKLMNAVQKAQVSWGRIKPLLKESIEPDSTSQIDFSQSMGLSVSGLSLCWPDSTQILREICFWACPGQIIGVTGSVASGKSTLGKAFINEIPYKGSIRVGDRELSGLSEYERSQMISYMGHQPELMSDSIEENIRLGEERSIAPYLQAVCLQQEVAQMPEGSATKLGNGGVRLSGGQQARVALARTLYHGKGILILDDPFSAVDRSTEREIFKNLRQLAADRIVILISHRLYLFPELDQVLFLEDGRDVFCPHQELMEKNAAYAGLYRAQLAGGEQYEN